LTASSTVLPMLAKDIVEFFHGDADLADLLARFARRNTNTNGFQDALRRIALSDR